MNRWAIFNRPYGSKIKPTFHYKSHCCVRHYTSFFCNKTLGVGTDVMILMVVPIVSAVFLTTAVTGAVLLHRQLAELPPSR